jgi:ribosomal protein S18 acetylase RimI-like enzyme
MAARVRLEGIVASALDGFLGAIGPPYAAERALADHIPLVEAQRFVRRQFEASLPQGADTPGHHFFRIVDTVTAVRVGVAWLRLDRASHEAYINNVTVFSEHRRKGYASAALEAIADLARADGCNVLALNVFAPNTAAQCLYRKFGLEVVSMHMNMLLVSPHRAAPAFKRASRNRDAG